MAIIKFPGSPCTKKAASSMEEYQKARKNYLFVHVPVVLIGGAVIFYAIDAIMGMVTGKNMPTWLLVVLWAVAVFVPASWSAPLKPDSVR
jgi:hypothetical protein